ncbi:MAG: hypothetical protein HY875_10095 [Chloroflexi bacterium]|nr:hypothetical protein [Chloroflexota bacterium]
MKVLRLGNSNEFSDGVPEEDRAAAVAERILAEGTGLEVQTVRKKIWPTDRLPGLVDEWMDEYQPDLVYLKLNVFWWTHESVPLRIERRVPLVGKYIARAGWKAQDTPVVATSTPGRSLRQVIERRIGGDTYYKPGEVVACMETVIRRIIAHEHAGLLVSGPAGQRPRPELTAAQLDRRNRRTSEVHRPIKALCDDLHVTYVGRDGPRPPDELERSPRGPDGFHSGVEGNHRMGKKQGEALLALWREMHREESRPLDAAVRRG